MFSWISVMLRNIHFGGRVVGIAANRCSQSTSPSFGAKCLRQIPDTHEQGNRNDELLHVVTILPAHHRRKRRRSHLHTGQTAPSGVLRGFGSIGSSRQRGKTERVLTATG